MLTNISDLEIKHILSNHYIGFLGYCHLQKPFVVPISFFYHAKKNVIIAYSNEGHKLQAMRKNKSVVLQVTEIDAISDWKSIMVHGNFELQSGLDAKALLHEFSLGIKEIIIDQEMRKVDFIKDFSIETLENKQTQVFVIRIEELTGKKRK